MVRRRHSSLAAFLLVITGAARAADPHAGQLLVATERSRDPDFRHSVVLLIHYDGRGAVGLMLNRPSKIAIADLLPDAGAIKGYAWAGGPVALGIVGLLRTRLVPQGAIGLLNDVALITDRKKVSALARTTPSVSSFRVYAGNCGWTVDQIQGEIRRGLWTISPATADLVFNRDPDKLWVDLAGR